MNKSENFDLELRELSRFAKAISHPARLSILKFLSETKTCISGDVSDNLPLSRTTVSQHLKELREIGLIQGDIDGLKINYCLNKAEIVKFMRQFDDFFSSVAESAVDCSTGQCTSEKNDNINIIK